MIKNRNIEKIENSNKFEENVSNLIENMNTADISINE
jgi:hypothetical protein